MSSHHVTHTTHTTTTTSGRTTTTGTTIARTAHPSPLLRTAALVSFLPALPLCVTHGALSRSAVPAVGLVPLFFSAAASLFLLVQARARARQQSRGGGGGGGGGNAAGKRPELVVVGDPERDAQPELGPEPEPELRGLIGRGGVGRAGKGEDEGEGAGRSGIEPDEDEQDEFGERDCGSGVSAVLAHRILVFVVDVVLAAGLMVVLVFTWVGTGRSRNRSPQLAMLAAYSTVPLLVNFLIHLFLAGREFVAGLALPGLVEYTAWRAVPPDCPHCGSRLRPDSFPPIPWYETVSRPTVSFPKISAPSFSRPSLPALKVPTFSALRGRREWKLPKWLSHGDDEHASLFVDPEQRDGDRYQDDLDEPYGGPSEATRAVVTGSTDPPPVVEEIVVAKKDRRAKSGSGSLFGEDESSWR